MSTYAKLEDFGATNNISFIPLLQSREKLEAMVAACLESAVPYRAGSDKINYPEDLNQPDIECKPGCTASRIKSCCMDAVKRMHQEVYIDIPETIAEDYANHATFAKFIPVCVSFAALLNMMSVFAKMIGLMDSDVHYPLYGAFATFLACAAIFLVIAPVAVDPLFYDLFRNIDSDAIRTVFFNLPYMETTGNSTELILQINSQSKKHLGENVCSTDCLLTQAKYVAALEKVDIDLQTPIDRIKRQSALILPELLTGLPMVFVMGALLCALITFPLFFFDIYLALGHTGLISVFLLISVTVKIYQIYVKCTFEKSDQDGFQNIGNFKQDIREWRSTDTKLINRLMIFIMTRGQHETTTADTHQEKKDYFNNILRAVIAPQNDGDDKDK